MVAYQFSSVCENCELNVNMSDSDKTDKKFPRSSLSRTTTTTSITTPVHPMELAVQSLLESPLELLNLSIHSLYESQMILTTILDRMQRKLDKCLRGIGKSRQEPITTDTDTQNLQYPNEHRNRANSDDDLKTQPGPDKSLTIEEYAARIHTIKLRIVKIHDTLDHVEKKIARINMNLSSA